MSSERETCDTGRRASGTARPKGTVDFMPLPASPDSGLFDSEQKAQAEQLFRELARHYGFREVVTPTFEHAELFTRSAGASSDIVTREMYSFVDRGNRTLVLRPEGTPGVVRAVLDAGLRLPVRLFYTGSFFRYSRPQKGRFREFHQLGVEALGEASPLTDAELIRLGQEFFSALGIADCLTAVNSIGCRLCRPPFRDKLVEFLQRQQEELCDDCRRRLELNPLRVFDCKLASCQAALDKAPRPVDHLCQDCSAHFAAVLADLRHTGTPVTVNSRLVRGLDYYSRTTFEYTSEALGAQDSLGGGGRYDYLIQELGGPDEPAVGFALGLERTLYAASATHQAPVSAPAERIPLVFIVWFGEDELAAARELAAKLRHAQVAARVDYEAILPAVKNRLKHQMKTANASAARFVVIVAPEELSRNVYSLKDLATGEQTEVPAGELITRIRQLLPPPRP